MIGAETPIGGVFQAGANFALYKPSTCLGTAFVALHAGALCRPIAGVRPFKE
jgi:hypothetical protein